MNEKISNLIFFVIAAILGVVSIIIPPLLSGVKFYNSPSKLGAISAIHLDNKITAHPRYLYGGKKWSQYAFLGQTIIIEGMEYKIAAVEDNIITLTTPFGGETGDSKSFTLVFTSPFPWIATGIRNFSFSAIGLLFLSGFLLGVCRPKHPFLWGLGVMSVFPIWTIADALIDTPFPVYSHNLFPFEFIIWGFLAMPAILGAYTGAFVRRKFIKKC